MEAEKVGGSGAMHQIIWLDAKEEGAHLLSML